MRVDCGVQAFGVLCDFAAMFTLFLVGFDWLLFFFPFFRRSSIRGRKSSDQGRLWVEGGCTDYYYAMVFLCRLLVLCVSCAVSVFVFALRACFCVVVVVFMLLSALVLNV